MAAIAFALLSAFGFGWTNVFMQLGLRGARLSPFTALLVNLVGGTVALAVVIPALGAFPSGGVSWVGVLYFALSGLVAGLAGQAANFAAIDRIGATRTASFVMTDNVFALVLAFVVLGQSISLMSGAGILILMLGAMAFIRETAGNNAGAVPAAPGSPGTGLPLDAAVTGGGAAAGDPVAAMARRRAGIALAVVSGFLFATAGIFRALGVAVMPAALMGAGINNAAALVAMLVAYAVMGRLREPLAVGWKRGVPLLLSGAASAVGTAGFILALQYGGTVAVSTALKNTAPLFTFVLAIWLLHRHERLNVRVAFLVALVVVGGVLAALGRT